MSTSFDPAADLIVISARLWGRGGAAAEVRLALDTGATHTLVRTSIVDSIGCDPGAASTQPPSGPLRGGSVFHHQKWYQSEQPRNAKPPPRGVSSFRDRVLSTPVDEQAESEQGRQRCRAHERVRLRQPVGFEPGKGKLVPTQKQRPHSHSELRPLFFSNKHSQPPCSYPTIAIPYRSASSITFGFSSKIVFPTSSTRHDARASFNFSIVVSPTVGTSSLMS